MYTIPSLFHPEHSPCGRLHDAAPKAWFILALTASVSGVMIHAQVVAKLMRHCGCNPQHTYQVILQHKRMGEDLVLLCALLHHLIFTPKAARASIRPEVIHFLGQPVFLGGEIIGSASWTVEASE